MARQLPRDTYAHVERQRFAMFWRQCRICRVSFKWEPFFTVFSDRDLKFPTEEDKARGIVRYFAFSEPQSVCVHCAEVYGIDVASMKPVLIEDFDNSINKMHSGEQPVPVHDNNLKKVQIVAREFDR